MDWWVVLVKKAQARLWKIFFCNSQFFSVCPYHVTYVFQSESILYSCLNVKYLLAQNRREIWSLSDCNGTRTYKHLVSKQTLNHLAKLAFYGWVVEYSFNSVLNGWMFVYELSGCVFESRCSHLNQLLYLKTQPIGPWKLQCA